MTLSEFWPYAAQELKRDGVKATTLLDYRRTIDLWTQLTDDPALASIRRWVISDWIERLQDPPPLIAAKWRKPQLAKDTIRKHCRQLRRILGMAADYETRDDRYRDGLITRVPKIKAPPAASRVKDALSMRQVEDCLERCGRAKRPQLPGIGPARWWRSLLIWLLNTGVRIGTAMATEWPMISEDSEGDGWWLQAPARILKGEREPDVFFVNAAAYRAASSVRVAGEPRLFVWPFTDRHLQRIRHELLGDVGFHAFRRTCGTVLTERADGNPAPAQRALGHTTSVTTEKHYIAKRAVKPLLKSQPQPKVRDYQLGWF